MQIITPVGITCYVNVFKAQAPMQAGKEPQYSATLLWDANDPKLKELKAAIVEVATAKFGNKAAQMLSKGQLKDPLRPGEDRPNDEVFEDKVFLTARSTDKPGVVDLNADPLMSQDDFYSGVMSRADIWLYAFDKAGNKGVAAILNNIQKVDDGDRLSGRRSAAEAFGNSAPE